MYTHDIRTIWKVIVINVLIVISWTFLVTPHSFRVLITIERGLAVYEEIVAIFLFFFTHYDAAFILLFSLLLK